MAIGDLIFQMMGREDPRTALRKLAATGGQAAPAGATPPAGDPTPAAMAGGDATAAATPPPQPQAYTSPPDLMNLYTKLIDRQDANRMIDRGFGLIGASLAQDQNKQSILNAFSGDQGSDTPDRALTTVGNIMTMQEKQKEIERKASMRLQLPEIAKRYGLDMKTAQYLFDAGKLDDVIASQEKPENKATDVKKYEYYVQQEKAAGREPKSFDEYSTLENKARTKFSLAPQYSVDKDGQVHSYQLSDSGGMQEVKDESGNPLTKPLVKSESDTEIIWQNPFDGSVVKREPKNVQQAAVEKEQGKAIADVRAKLPGLESAAEVALKTADDIEKSPALNDNFFGGGLGIPGTIFRSIPGTDAYTLNVKINQAKGAAFLDAYNSLRGTGSISEIEGAKATAAKERLDAAQNPKDFKEALADYKAVIRTGLENARKIARGEMKPFVGSGDDPAAPTTGDIPKPPSIDDILKKYRKKP